MTDDLINVDPSVKERFWIKVQKTDNCWNWTAYVDRGGYGHLRLMGRDRLVHRLAYGWLVGPIPEGLTIDHICRNRRCVNPAHLQALTMRENVMRAGTSPTTINAVKTGCIYGHEYTPDNTYINPTTRARGCKICRRQADRRYKARRRTTIRSAA